MKLKSSKKKLGGFLSLLALTSKEKTKTTEQAILDPCNSPRTG